ncbi:hypothetical protein GJ496_011495 [Pomphorhynchus laevis]|nr:hypothetical protein GJ496_011495 [Pomphorhynchus laevis]
MLKSVAVLGSGGHTSEMMTLIQSIPETLKPVHYIIAESDKTTPNALKNTPENFIHKIHRSREVNQNMVLSLLVHIPWAMLECLFLMWRLKPDFVLVNGPGTCVPVCFVAWFLSKLRLNPPCKIVFVESICRVQSLSLSARILLNIVTCVLVQWPELLHKYPNKNLRYIGQLS